MRLRILLENTRPVRLSFSHQDQLRGLLYRVLGASDADYARFLHDEGYAVTTSRDKGESPDTHRRFKLFNYSTIRAPRHRRQPDGDHFRLAPGLSEWQISSPLTDFLQHSATGLLSLGAPLQVGEAAFTIAQIEAVNAPRFGERAEFTCLTPIVASVPAPDGRKTAYYLRPTTDAAQFSDVVRKNLLQKYALVHKAPPADDRLTLTFKADYLARSPHSGTKKITIRNCDFIGAEAPFTLTGSPALLELAWSSGLGQGNSTGFGMIEVSRS